MLAPESPIPLETAQDNVYQSLKWVTEFQRPVLSAGTGSNEWVKHEGHSSVGVVKIRGELTYLEHYTKGRSKATHMIFATLGNYGQSCAIACALAALLYDGFRRAV